MFKTIPVMVAFAGMTIVLVENCGSDEEVPKPIQPLSLTD